MSPSEPSLYETAREEMERLIEVYLSLLEASDGLSALKAEHLDGVDSRRIVLAGIGAPEDAESVDSDFAVREYGRRSAVTFDVETAITTGVYLVVRGRAAELLADLADDTSEFSGIDAEYIERHPHLLPILMRIAGIFSKAELKRKIGAASDQRIGAAAAARLGELLQARVARDRLSQREVLGSLEATIEGIVRDLVGRLLLESLVENALESRALNFKRESEYSALTGVVYDFRADFVLPDEVEPRAFIEVRKSSSRHASLYAKDKMFSAINWKGQHPDLLGVLVVDGEWTQATLRILPQVFDYVVPMTELPALADTLDAYLKGDSSKLKWLVTFAVKPA
jgi:hypothetical protein